MAGAKIPEADSSQSLFLVIPAPLREVDGRLCFESQACNGMAHWAGHFDRITCACTLRPEQFVRTVSPTSSWVPLDDIGLGDRVKWIPLPWGYGWGNFLRHYEGVRAVLRREIPRHRYLSFAIGGLVGDWASLACVQAIRAGRSFSVWTDNVAHRVAGSGLTGFKKYIQNWVMNPAMIRYQRYILRKCSLGMFNGQACYDAYAPFCRNPHLVYDVSLKEEDQIAPDRLQCKLEELSACENLKIVYAGRLIEIKGVMDWIMAMRRLKDLGLRYVATWYGDGPLRSEALSQVSRAGLQDCVFFPGNEPDRAQLMRHVEDGHVFAFCHKTEESPRCLIEAMKKGVPMVGYDNAYPRQLLGGQGGLGEQCLVPHSPSCLATRIAELAANRPQLVSLAEKVANLGQQYSDVNSFALRSGLIKQCS